MFGYQVNLPTSPLEATRMVPVKTILVPTDFSETAELALRYGKALASAFQATLHILHVLQDPLLYVPITEGYGALPNFREQLEGDARRHLERLVTDSERQTLQIQLALKWGTPFVEIVEYARQHQVDLIVLGTHGRGAVMQMLLGSVAEKVVRKAPCPVLTVRPTDTSVAVP